MWAGPWQEGQGSVHSDDVLVLHPWASGVVSMMQLNEF